MEKTFSFLKRFKWLLIIILVIAGIFFYSTWKSRNNAPTYLTDTVTRTTISDIINETGNVYAEGQANIYSSTEGIVDKIYVNDNDAIYEGRSLFLIHTTSTDQEKTTAYSNLLTAQSNLKTAEQGKLTLQAQIDTASQTLITAQNNLRVITKAILTGSLNSATQNKYSKFDSDAAKLAVKSAEENLNYLNKKMEEYNYTTNASQAALDSASSSYDAKNYITIKAPTSGNVSNISIAIGDKVSSSNTSATATPALIISKPGKILFKSQINEIDVIKIKTEMPVKIKIDAIKNKEFDGKISKIDTIGTNVQGVVSYNVYFSIENIDENIRPTMSGSTTIETDKRTNVLTVANAAIKPYQDGKAVQVIDETKPKKGNVPEFKYIPVKTGIKNTERTEILEGLNEGTQVIINNTGNQFKSNLFGG